MPEIFILLGLVMSIIWIVIGWRAMRAHESLAVEAKRANNRLDEMDRTDVRGQMNSQNRAYREFVRAHPEVEQLSSKDRHERFREWELEREESH